MFIFRRKKKRQQAARDYMVTIAFELDERLAVCKPITIDKQDYYRQVLTHVLNDYRIRE